MIGVRLDNGVNLVGLLMTEIHIEITNNFCLSPLQTAFLLMCENEATRENASHMFSCIYTSVLLRISKLPNSIFSCTTTTTKKKQDNYRPSKTQTIPKGEVLNINFNS